MTNREPKVIQLRPFTWTTSAPSLTMFLSKKLMRWYLCQSVTFMWLFNVCSWAVLQSKKEDLLTMSGRGMTTWSKWWKGILSVTSLSRIGDYNAFKIFSGKPQQEDKQGKIMAIPIACTVCAKAGGEESVGAWALMLLCIHETKLYSRIYPQTAESFYGEFVSPELLHVWCIRVNWQWQSHTMQSKDQRRWENRIDQ